MSSLQLKYSYSEPMEMSAARAICRVVVLWKPLRVKRRMAASAIWRRRRSTRSGSFTSVGMTDVRWDGRVMDRNLVVCGGCRAPAAARPSERSLNLGVHMCRRDVKVGRGQGVKGSREEDAR